MAPRSRHAIAVDVGATNIRAALISSSGRMAVSLCEPTDVRGRHGEVVTKQIIRMIRAILTKSAIKKPAGIGVASIGPLDYKRGGPVRSPNVPFSFIPLVAPLRRAFGLPVTLLNDANAAVLGEQRFGAGRGRRDIIYITISTGIGAGVIAGGNLLLGKSGNAAELGHMIVDSAYALPCSCTKGRGHWEAYASGRNMPRFFAAWLDKNDKNKRRPGAGPKDAASIFRLAAAGDRDARMFLNDLAKINARAVSTIIAAYDPELITFGGSVALNNQAAIIPGIKKYVDRYLKVPQISITPLGEDVVLLGAAAGVFSASNDAPRRSAARSVIL